VADRGVVGYIHARIGDLQDLPDCPEQGGEKKQGQAEVSLALVPASTGSIPIFWVRNMVRKGCVLR